MVDRFVALEVSPLVESSGPVPIRYRDTGEGPPLLILHGGWGYDMYPFDRQMKVLAARRRIVAPDRTGYGQSGTLDVQRADFHRRAAGETLAVLDALGIERPTVWGHSDGAVIALHLGLMAPERVGGIIGEATHFFRRKPASRSFFETMRDNPAAFGERVAAKLQHDHGSRWKALLRTNGRAWIEIADTAASSVADLYGGRLPTLRVPVLLIHGGQDPRTEPGELDALRSAIPGARCECLPAGAHSPHSERATADAVTEIVNAWTA